MSREPDPSMWCATRRHPAGLGEARPCDICGEWCCEACDHESHGRGVCDEEGEDGE